MILERPYHVILQNVSTNWNSSYYVFKACLNNKKTARKMNFELELENKASSAWTLTTKCLLQKK